LENRTKPNDQLFTEYFYLIANTHAEKSLYEAKRILNKFREFLGEYPPSVELAMQFLSQFRDRKLNTLARYQHVVSAFFRWYGGEGLPFKIKVPKILPQYVPAEDIDRLIKTIEGKRSHKKIMERDVLLIHTARLTGLRRGELANLKVGDLHLSGSDPVLIVRSGKGNKDRSVGLVPALRDRLAAFTRGKPLQDSVFGITAKSISGKMRQWAIKAGVPHLHTHSLRHYVGTTLFERGANPRAVQAILGHESLEVTMGYAAVTGQDIRETIQLLEPRSVKHVEEEPEDTFRTVKGSDIKFEKYPQLKGDPEYDYYIGSKHVPEIIKESQRDHMAEVRSLIETWCSGLKIPSPPSVSPHPLSIVEECEQNRLFQGLSVHLPFPELWRTYSSFKSKWEDYLGLCNKLHGEVVDQATREWGLALLQTNEPHPRLTGSFYLETADRAMRIATGSPKSGKPAYEATASQVGEAVQGLACDGRLILYAEGDVESYADKHWAMIRKWAKSDEVADIVAVLGELDGLENKLQGMLEEVLLRRDYILYVCRLCPGEGKLAFK